MYILEYGNQEEPILVFLHGGGVGGWMWNQQVDYFKNYHVLIPTLQGHGDRSEETDFSIRGNAIEVIELIQQKKNEKDIHIIGFSIGAQICLEIISLAPNLIKSAMINSAVVIPMMSMIPFISPTIKMTYPLTKNKKFAKAQAKQLYMDGDYFEKYYEDSLKIKPTTLINILKENMSYTLPENFAESTARILVTVGDKEKGLVKKSVQRIVDGNDRCEALFVPNIGHGFPVAQPDLFNKVLQDWIEHQKVYSL
ncbi:alpha/beta hydrolase [Sporosarcina sp. ACRSL]|uniref:alpha/beta fold hydrolase n=1 Tax=Sporosarcina sp. ACRSL TaxID=2918215 RepID=UPI001EF5ABFD|nr:alpha/beta hydrolase [Sporosarcina sp. ACRSL]MCG7342621.1 alpha/beta hydrolase [Sporosarcina sp. ACRSL]